jgi:hypothetical protein
MLSSTLSSHAKASLTLVDWVLFIHGSGVCFRFFCFDFGTACTRESSPSLLVGPEVIAHQCHRKVFFRLPSRVLVPRPVALPPYLEESLQPRLALDFRQGKILKALDYLHGLAVSVLCFRSKLHRLQFPWFCELR